MTSPHPQAEPYSPVHPVRIVTAASLFDGHDAAINIMRRILQATGVEVIHLGHNRAVHEIVDCAIEEDAQGIALTSYQGGHIEYLKYMYDLLQQRAAGIKIFAGGGGTILPSEIDALQAYGIARVYSPDDGRAMGLQGMINEVVEQCDFPTVDGTFDGTLPDLQGASAKTIAQLITLAENHETAAAALERALGKLPSSRVAPVLGVTGTGGRGQVFARR